MTAARPDVSVVIPALNAAATLPEQLAALAAQAYAGQVEVIVADNGSSDGTQPLVAGWDAPPEVRLVDAANRRGPAAARNLGAQHARGEVLAFCDADDVVGPGWLAAHVAALGQADLVAGAVVPFRSARAGPVPRNPPRLLHFLPYASGSNMAVRRSTFAELGGFDESLLVGEDVDFCWRAQLAGKRFTYQPGATVRKRERAGVPAVVRQYFGYGRHDMVLLRRYRTSGARRERPAEAARVYLGLLARLPALVRRDQRDRWARQLGRRAGRFAGPPPRLDPP